MPKENWEDIHWRFSDNYHWGKRNQNLWKNHGFDYQKIKEWKEALGKSFKVEHDHVFCAWLRDEKHLTPQKVKQQSDLESLRTKYNKIWIKADKDFGGYFSIGSDWTYQRLWEEQGLTHHDAKEQTQAGFKPKDIWIVKEWKKQIYETWKKFNFSEEEIKSWIDAGAKLNDLKFVVWLRDTKNLGSEWIINYKEDYEILRNRFKKYGLCPECQQPNTGENWCQFCNESRIKKNFANWTSHNSQIDQFIQKYQLVATDADKFLEWIPYEQFTEIEYLAEGGFGKVYRAKWIEGNVFYWDIKSRKWCRKKDYHKELQKKIDSRKNALEQLMISTKNKLKSKSKFSESKRKERRIKLELFFKNLPTDQDEFIRDLVKIKLKLSRRLTPEEISDLCFGKEELIHLQEKKEGFKNQGEEEYGHKIVVLKSLNNSRKNTNFLDEVAKYKIIDDWFNNIAPCYGLSQDPNTGNYLMVMQYMPEGNLRNYLSNKNRELTLKDKLNQLLHIAQGLKDIHAKNLVHRDFHSGNILKGIEKTSCLITDLGLCKPANEMNKEEKVFGVLPYVAPEVLQSQPYTQASDVYSFGIIAYEMLSGLPPYYDKNHDQYLGITICQGIRPQFQIKIPQLLEDLIERCWNADPGKRPTANELKRTLRSWEQGNTEFIQQLQAAEEYNENLPDEVKFPDYKKKMHTGAVYASRLLPTKEITQLLQNYQETFGSSEISMTGLLDNLPNTILEENQQQEQTAQILQPTNQPYGIPGSSK